MPRRAISAPRQPRVGVSRPAMWRIYEIHSFIRAGDLPNCATLAREIEVTQKTIQRDISFMRDQLGLPLEYDQGRHGYYYTQDVGEFPVVRLTQEELVALFLARQALEPLRNTRLGDLIGRGLDRLTLPAGDVVTFSWRELEDVFSVRAAGVAEADVELFHDLSRAVIETREVSFDYHKLKGKTAEPRRAQPYHIAQVDHGWYLFAHDLQRDAMRTFSLSRIKNLRLEKRRFQKPLNFDLANHLDHGFTVWTHEPRTDEGVPVRIRFTGWAARLISERQWHPSQKIRQIDPDGDELELTLKIREPHTLRRWILSWGRRAQVIEPAELREMVREEAAEMVSLHLSQAG